MIHLIISNFLIIFLSSRLFLLGKSSWINTICEREMKIAHIGIQIAFEQLLKLNLTSFPVSNFTEPQYVD